MDTCALYQIKWIEFCLCSPGKTTVCLMSPAQPLLTARELDGSSVYLLDKLISVLLVTPALVGMPV